MPSATSWPSTSIANCWPRSLFAQASPEFLRALSLKLEHRPFRPGDVILRRGEPGESLLFIREGLVQVLDSDDKSTLAELGDGQFFGEGALLSDRPRSATVRALTYCDLYSLEREAFQETTKLFPEFAQTVEQHDQDRSGRSA